MIKLEICQGTTCYVMGASKLAELATTLPDDLKDKVTVSGIHCSGHCKDGAFGDAPYVLIDGVVHGGATKESIIALLRKRVAEIGQ